MEWGICPMVKKFCDDIKQRGFGDGFLWTDKGHDEEPSCR
jgi:hypothetical protein